MAAQKLKAESLADELALQRGTQSGFANFYEPYMYDMKSSASAILELGYTFNSLVFWNQYFPNAQIVGINSTDPQDYNTNPSLSNTSLHNIITCLYADQSVKESLDDSLLYLNEQDKPQSYDIIVDNGEQHTSKQQRNALEKFWPYVKSDGLYIIENMQYQNTSWFPTDSTNWRSDSSVLLDDLTNFATGSSSYSLPILSTTVRQVILFSKNDTKTAACVLIKI
jgi:hypothetical protein